MVALTAETSDSEDRARLSRRRPLSLHSDFHDVVEPASTRAPVYPSDGPRDPDEMDRLPVSMRNSRLAIDVFY